MTEQITFEHPLNERCRTLLRLSHLFGQYRFHTPKDADWNSRAAVGALLDIAMILSRADIKSDLLKEMDRYRGSLDRIANKPGVDSGRFDAVMQQIDEAEGQLRAVQGQLGQALRTDDFLNSIQQRSSIPGGSFDFDLPQFHYWLHRSQDERRQSMDAWLEAVAPVEKAVELSISLIRGSATPVREIASQGLFQRTLDNQLPLQLLRISVPHDAKLFPETSGSKHRFAIRFMSAADCRHPKSVSDDVQFMLTTCII